VFELLAYEANAYYNCSWSTALEFYKRLSASFPSVLIK